MNIAALIANKKILLCIGLATCLIIIFILIIIILIQLYKLKKKYQRFIIGNDGKSLEEVILTRLGEVDQLKEKASNTDKQIKEIKETLLSTYQKMGVVKYDAFCEMGGKLSFALAILDDTNSGVIINSMHSGREGCYTYAKEIIHGESFVVLSEEEKNALQLAMNKKNYME